ncbi:UNVERIFIED_CONTAM: hypothetical protein K2H54_057689 [Gekko kuhli]
MVLEMPKQQKEKLEEDLKTPQEANEALQKEEHITASGKELNTLRRVSSKDEREWSSSRMPPGGGVGLLESPAARDPAATSASWENKKRIKVLDQQGAQPSDQLQQAEEALVAKQELIDKLKERGQTVQSNNGNGASTEGTCGYLQDRLLGRASHS